ncbi:sensor histidine kinase [Microbacterium sp. p3-SID338]|uniref:sensor histidine kinase n=1 Tax=unclassified Microbacterium TaxID=2609290 RepID=UPI000C7FD414|nr:MULTISPECIES: sensor histidine kinase [unclassified Microbacterium]MCT1395902.1 sensor histidine kinase [Microbacterium sp. p3-SID338]PMC07065.1 histidine kinase [Microbacterium sp. UMB0228]
MSPRRRVRFATRALLLHLAAVALVVTLCTGVYLALAVQQLRAEAESTALGIARTLAEDAQVRAAVAAISASDDEPDAEALRDGDLQQIATDVMARTGALFVVITDDEGIRLAHPLPSRIGEVVSTPFAAVLAGHEVVDWQTGTLGESARAKVPVRDDSGTPVGEISVGFERNGVFDDLPPLLAALGLTAAGALALALLAFLLLRRRWERLTIGVQPEELVALVQNQTAVLDGVGDGVLAVDQDGVVRVSNAAADRLLGLHDPIGRPVDALPLPPVVRDTATGARDRAEAVVGDRMLYLESRAVRRDGRALGDVLIVRDRTDLIALTERLEAVRTMTSALRVQRHEFANRLHVAAGLIDAGRVDDARAFLDELVSRGPVTFPVTGLDLVGDPFLHAFLGAKGVEAAERGVALRIAADTQVIGTVRRAEDVASVLGNLVDNAVVAAVAGTREPRWVDVSVLSDGDALVVTVADSGEGLRPSDPRPRADDGGGDSVHGHGIGLPLATEIARRSGGDLWIIDPGGPDHGAVFAARLGDAVDPAPRVPKEDR